MKKFTFKLALLFFILINAGIISAQYNLEKNSSHEFNISSSSSLFADVQFSEIEVLNWDKPFIKTDVNVTTSGSDKKTIESLLNSIEVSVTQEGQNVYINTILPDKLTNRRDAKFEIKIEVYSPKYINVNLDNKYGTAYIEEISGQASLNTSYGTLNVQNLTRGNKLPLNQINISYGKATIESANWVKSSAKYSKLNVDEANMITVFSKYSSINIDRAESVASEAKYDTYKLGEIDSFIGNLEYGNINMNVLNDILELNAEYSNIKIMEVSENFSQIKLDTKNGGCKIFINPSASFSFKGKAESGNLNVEGLVPTKQVRENANLILEGSYGKTRSGQINVNVKNGAVNISLL